MKKITNKIARAGMLALWLCLSAGCATTSKTPRKAYYFFPPPPNEPRFQYLTGFSSEKDFRGSDERSFMSYVTGQVPPDKAFSKPYGAAAHGKKLYVCDTDARAVLVMDLQRGRIGVLETEGEGGLSLPVNLAIEEDGSCYIADAGREQVVIFDKDGNFADALGKTGEMKPRDVTVDRRRIYVADIQNRLVRVYDKASRKWLLNIPCDADRTNAMHALYIPTNLAVDSRGRLYVADTGACHVQVYDASGNYLRTIGALGDGTGEFARVKGLAIDKENRIYAADAMSGVIQIFDDQGQVLTWFGDPENGGLMQNLPAKVLLDYDDVELFQRYAAPNFKIEYLIIVTNQLGPHKICVYGFGHMK